MSEDIRLWGSRRKTAPARPEFPEIYPETDERHWYDLEYAGWGVKKAPQPSSPLDGPSGKRVIAIHHSNGHPYMTAYDGGMRREAERFGVTLEILHSEWDPERESGLVDEAIAERPDLIVLAPESPGSATPLLKRIHAAGIPVLASNLLPEAEGHRYCLAWTGPDDWGQFRLLARRFSELMGAEGGYALVGHVPGSSASLARRWAVVTELSKTAPRMELLAAAETSLDAERTRRVVVEWLKRYGKGLRGIISADDSLAQLGINRALGDSGREDLIRVASGATTMGLRFLREGSLLAITAQSPELDGALPIRAAVDYWNGLELEPVRYLPIDLIERPNLEDYLLSRSGEPEIDLDSLSRIVAECDLQALDRFFRDLLERLRQERMVSEDWFRGFSIELLSRLSSFARSVELPPETLAEGYEGLFKRLTRQPSPRETISWLEAVARRVMAAAVERKRGCLSLGERVRLYVDEHWREPLSLKTLSARFGLSAAYLGRAFREDTGKSFASYLNELRIAHAERMLAGRKIMAKDVALAVGYSDANYFYTVFKRITGRYPSEIRGGEDSRPE